jgi:hypothetical protein
MLEKYSENGKHVGECDECIVLVVYWKSVDKMLRKTMLERVMNLKEH